MFSFSSTSRIFAVTFVMAAFLAGCTTTGSSGTSTAHGSKDKVDAVLERAANDASARGQTRHSLSFLEKIYQRNASDPLAAAKYARALREDGQINKARLILKPFIDGGTEDPSALTEMAMVQLALGQNKEAEKTARQAVTADPKNGRSYLALGTALDAQSYHKQAEVAFRKGLDHWAGDPAPILNNLALNLASQGHLEESISILRKAKAASPHRLEIERNLRIISTLLETSGPVSPSTPPPKPGKKPPVPQKQSQVQAPAVQIALQQPDGIAAPPATIEAPETLSPLFIRPHQSSTSTIQPN